MYFVLIWGYSVRGWVYFHSFACGHSVVSALFVEKAVLFLFILASLLKISRP